MASVTPQRLRVLADQIAAREGIPPSLFAAVITQESGWNPSAKSPVGARGLTQLMPATAKGLGVTNPDDPVQNLSAGAKYLRMQLDHFGSIPLALAAYNAGPGNVTKYKGVPPFAETQAYVRNILAHMQQGAPMPAILRTPDGALGTPKSALAAPPAAPSIAERQAIELQALKPTGPTPSLGDFLSETAPTAAAQSILQRMGGSSAGAIQGASQPIPTVNLAPMTDPPMPQLSSPAEAGIAEPKPGQGTTVQQLPQMPLHGKISTDLAGQIPMTPGGKAPFKNLTFASHTDWQHVDPRLLTVVDHVLEMHGLKGQVISGYRDNRYSATHGGFANDPHTKGHGLDIYVGGKPIGDVIPPDVWQKFGITSGAVPNFYKGHPDPEHLQI
jgi:hypothetical protein